MLPRCTVSLELSEGVHVDDIAEDFFFFFYLVPSVGFARMAHTPWGTHLAKFENYKQFFCKQVVCLFSGGLRTVWKN